MRNAPALGPQSDIAVSLEPVDGNLDQTLTSLCRHVEALAPGATAGLTLCNTERTHLQRALFPGLPAFGASIVDVPIKEPFFGSCINSVARGEIITCPNIALDTRFDVRWQQLCLDHGIRSLQSRPVVLRDGRPFGTFVLTYATQREESDWNASLMTFAADAAGWAIQADLDRRISSAA